MIMYNKRPQWIYLDIVEKKKAGSLGNTLTMIFHLRLSIGNKEYASMIKRDLPGFLRSITQNLTNQDIVYSSAI